MNLSKLGKATRLYDEIRTIDAEIIEIEKFAMMIANGETKCSFELSVEDLIKKDEKVGFNEDGSIIYSASKGSFTFGLNSILYGTKQPLQPENIQRLKFDLTDNSAMQMLGVMLYDKQTKRQSLIAQLEKMGVTI